MSLWESGDSSGEVSLASLLEGGRCLAKDVEQTYSGVASVICRGGWPRMIKMAPDTAQARLRDYLDNITRTDISRVSGIKRDPQLVMALLASLARNEATAASGTTLIKDVAGEAGQAGTSRHAPRLGPTWTT